MKRDRGVAFCGLACCVCSKNDNCLGCRNDGCKDKDWCKHFKCCKEKGLKGCWECDEFPCTGGMLDNLRVRAFAKFIKQYGEDELMRCLERNEKNGIVYHYDGQLVGDYDKLQTEAEIILMIKHGFKNNM